MVHSRCWPGCSSLRSPAPLLSQAAAATATSRPKHPELGLTKNVGKSMLSLPQVPKQFENGSSYATSGEEEENLKYLQTLKFSVLLAALV